MKNEDDERICASRTLGAKSDTTRASQAGWPVSPVYKRKTNPFEVGSRQLINGIVAIVQDTISESLLDFPWKSKTPAKALWSLRNSDLSFIALYPSL